MVENVKPQLRPAKPYFSSGPCTKRPAWSPQVLSDACLGRSHRSLVGREKLRDVIARSRKLLEVPENYRVGIVPASDTGAVEMSLWSLLGPRGVDIFSWESFGAGWVEDIVNQLKLPDVRVMDAVYGDIPELAMWNPDRDLVFTWNGTTSGVCVPDGEWISDDREGLTICDATSAVFAMELPWQKLDVVTWSWQKVLGSEAAHGMIALSPRAVERLETYSPIWPLPKIFRMTKKGKLIEGIFRGETINTPSMLSVEDVLDALKWAEDLGGLSALISISKGNLDKISKWVAGSYWVDFLAKHPAIRSSTSVCLRITDAWFDALSAENKSDVPRVMETLLEEEAAAFDINGYRDAPPGLRIWAGATVDTEDLERLFPWLDWAYETVKNKML